MTPLRLCRSLLVVVGLLALGHVHVADGNAEVASLDSVAAVEPVTGVSTKSLLEDDAAGREEAAASKAADAAAKEDGDEAPESVAAASGCQCMTRAELQQWNKEKGIRTVAASIAAPPAAVEKKPCASDNKGLPDPAAALAKMAAGDDFTAENATAKVDTTASPGEKAVLAIADEAKAKADEENAAATLKMTEAKAAVAKAAVDKRDAERIHAQAVATHKAAAVSAIAEAQAALDTASSHKAKAEENEQQAIATLERVKQKAGEVGLATVAADTVAADTNASAVKTYSSAPATNVSEVANVVTKPASKTQTEVVQVGTNGKMTKSVSVNATGDATVETKTVDAKDGPAEPTSNMDAKTASDYIEVTADKKDANGEPKRDSFIDVTQDPLVDPEANKTSASVSGNVTALSSAEAGAELPAADCVCKPGTGPIIAKVDQTQSMDSKTVKDYVEITKPDVAQNMNATESDAVADGKAEAAIGGDGVTSMF